MYTLIVRTTFEAAHLLPRHAGKCSKLHGHSYHVEAEFASRTLNDLGMVMDFSELKAAVEEVVPDHTFLNDVIPLPTTAENIARWLYEQLRERNLPVAAITVWETDRNACRYTQD